MLDVLHYYFEEDMQAATEEESNAKSEMRSVVYRTFYGKTYKYANKKSGSQTFSDGSELPDDGYYGDLTPFDPSETNVTKSYVPATEMDADSPLPFGKILDAPVN